MIIFTITGGLGILFTALLIYRANKKGGLSHHRHALTVSIGLGLTWMIAPVVPFLVSATHIADNGLIMFWIGHSVLITMALYIFDRLYLKFKR